MPFSVHAWRTVYRNLIILAHNMVIVPFVLIIFGRTRGLERRYHRAGADHPHPQRHLGQHPARNDQRYRDVPPIVMSLVQVIFFITPIFWPPEALGVWMQALFAKFPARITYWI
jgi:ABC-type polysaccharide/polyol phosphate export permease